MSQLLMKKSVIIDKRADKEIRKFGRKVLNKFRALFDILKDEGVLAEPFAKKLSETGLFEVRVKYRGQYRALYAYFEKEYIVILTAFIKKTQKTPLHEISKAKKRLSEYQEIL